MLHSLLPSECLLYGTLPRVSCQVVRESLDDAWTCSTGFSTFLSGDTLA